MGTNEIGLLRAILATVARQTFPPQEIAKIVAPRSDSAKWIEVYNLCNGARTQSEIAKEANVDSSNLSKKVRQWTDAGVMTLMVEGAIERPIHVYPLPDGIDKG